MKNNPTSYVVGFDHVQVAMPKGEEERARSFYVARLGLVELQKPADLASRGGLWLACGELQLHLGVEDPFRPARKAHPALRIRRYMELLSSLQAAGHEISVDTTRPGVERAFVADPFGNRIELINAESAVSS
jgi:catechol 2,3-dioxygenase-like lactoylglutathione lyase family enzyme